jgi:periplasmic copper chaperone A
MLRRLIICFALAAVAFPAAAGAHVTLNPREWEAGGFARFDVRVPNERPNANTTEVTVQFPDGLTFVSFQPKSGWKRTVKMETLAEPIEVFGEEVTEQVASVTWSGGVIKPGEFDEFGVSFRVPETPGESLLFPSIQTYSNGEIVRWIDPDPEAETPAPQVEVLEPPAEEESAAAGATTEETTTEAAAAEASGDETAAVPAVGSDDDDDSMSTVALIFGIAGLAAGLVALGVALFRKPKTTT